MRQNIITPQELLVGPGMGHQVMEIHRPPQTHRCPKCRKPSVVILPRNAGKIAWLCACGQNNFMEFGEAQKNLVPDQIKLQLTSKPLLHECDHCHQMDYIVLPARGGGDMRWTCTCGSVWLIRWRPASGGKTTVMRAQVREGKKAIIEVPGQEAS